MPTTHDLNLRQYRRIIRKRKGIVIYSIVMMTFFGFIFSIIGHPTPLYRADASVKIEQTSPATGFSSQAASWSSTNHLETHMAMIKSYFILELVAKRIGLIPPALSSEAVLNTPHYRSAILDLQDRVETQQEGNSDIIHIAATSEDPKDAQRLANTIAKVYGERHGLDHKKRIAEAGTLIENQLGGLLEKLQKSEEAIRDFRETHRIVSLNAQSASLINQLANLQSAQDRDEATLGKIYRIAKLLARAAEAPPSSRTVFYFEEALPPYKALNDRLVQLLLERDMLLLSYTDLYPRVVEIQKEIHEIAASLQSHLTAQKQALSQAIDRRQNRIAALNDQLRDLPGKGMDLARLTREVNINKEIYTLLEKQYQESLIRQAEKLEEVQIIKPALEPINPSNPPRTAAMTALGMLIGMILGVLFAFISESADTPEGEPPADGERKQPTTTRERKNRTLLERLRQPAKGLPSRGRNSKESPEKAPEKRPPAGSGGSLLRKTILLLLVLGLLIAGLYYALSLPYFTPAPSSPGPAAPQADRSTPPPPIPTPAARTNHAADRVTAAPPIPEGPPIPAVKQNDAVVQRATAPPVQPRAADKPYVVQVRATQDARVARETVEALKTRGHDAYGEKVVLEGKGVWLRVFIGRFASEREARQYIESSGIKTVYPDFIVRRTDGPSARPSPSSDPLPGKNPPPR